MDDLRDFIASVKGAEAIRVEESLGNGFVRLMVDEAERRQAKHDIRCSEDVVVEMLRNARDADATKIFLATTRSEDMRSIVVLDNGCGIPPEMAESVFEARVTSKLDTLRMDRWGVHGRGMALFSIKQNSTAAEVVASDLGKGSSIRILLDAATLGERKDQSTWPSVGRDEDNHPVVTRGPHNIIRTCCEFALEERGLCDVWIGSPAEIIATVRARITKSMDDTTLLFIDDLTELPVLQRLCVPQDARELQQTAQSLGLDISERTAHRILSGAIRPVRSVYAKLTHHSDPDMQKDIDLLKDRRGLKMAREDIDEFSRIMEGAFDYIAEKYYVSLVDEPRIRVGSDKIVITFDLEKQD
jgi:hypothetical protein